MESVEARGASGITYKYFVLPPPIVWPAVPVNYMFAKRIESLWVVVYIGQSDNALRTMPRHVLWDEAVEKYGATHCLAHQGSSNEAERSMEERDLIASHGPPMNITQRPARGLGLAG